MEKQIKVTEEEIFSLKKLQYLLDGRKDIIAYILSTGMTIPTEQFENYQKDYDDFYLQYQEAKKDFEKRIVRVNISKPISWSLDFDSNIVTINYEE